MCQILLIEDHPNQRLLYEQELADEGYREIVTASSGLEGLEFFKYYRPQLIILDIVLPEMNGIEVMKHMLTLDPQASIIVHSAYSSPCHDFITWFAKYYVVKSGDLDELKRKVRQLLRAETARHNSAVAAPAGTEHMSRG